MLDGADIALLLAVVFVLAIFHLSTWRRARVERQRALKYKLYRVRDDLIYLVASGKLKEEQHVFQYFYKASNALIGATEKVTLSSMIRALSESRKKGLDPAEKRHFDRLNAEIQQENPEVQKVLMGFYVAVAEILTENSVLLRQLRWLVHRVEPLWNLLNRGRIAENYRRAYGFYKDYARAVACSSL